MKKRRFMMSLVLAVATSLWANRAAHADPLPSRPESVLAQGMWSSLPLTGPLLSALDEASTAHDGLVNAREVARAIEHGQPPAVGEDAYFHLAEQYRHAAAVIAAQVLPTEFNPTPYRFSVDELRACATRDRSIAQARGYLGELNQAQARGREAVARLERNLAEVDGARAVLRELLNLNQQLSAHPLWGQAFAWNWLALETNVSQALGTLDSALRERKRRVETAVQAAQAAASNLSANIPLLEGLRCRTEIVREGSLVPGDQVLAEDQSFVDWYTIQVRQGDALRVEMTSGFDAFLILVDASGRWVARDDDSAGGTNARIQFTAPSAGEYRVGANSYARGSTGPYRLVITINP